MAAEDVVFIAVMLLVVGTGLFVIGYVGNTAASQIATQPVVNESSYAVSALNALEDTTERFDILFLAVFIGLTLGVILLSWFVPTHPIFYIAYFLILVITIVVSAVMANVWELIGNNAQMVSMLTNFPIMNHILSYLPVYMAVVGFVGVTTMFAKPYLTEGGM